VYGIDPVDYYSADNIVYVDKELLKVSKADDIGNDRKWHK
jgi:hypothetical protein